MKLWTVVKQQTGPETIQASRSLAELVLLVAEDHPFVQSHAVKEQTILYYYLIDYLHCVSKNVLTLKRYSLKL